MKKKIVSIILTVLLVITNISFIVNAEVTYDYTLEYIKLKLKYNALLNPYAAAANDGGIYATLVCNQISSQPYTTIIGDPGSGYPSEQEIWTIPKNTPFDLYIVIGGLSSLPVEVQFYAQ